MKMRIFFALLLVILAACGGEQPQKNPPPNAEAKTVAAAPSPNYTLPREASYRDNFSGRQTVLEGHPICRGGNEYLVLVNPDGGMIAITQVFEEANCNGTRCVAFQRSALHNRSGNGVVSR